MDRLEKGTLWDLYLIKKNTLYLVSRYGYNGDKAH